MNLGVLMFSWTTWLTFLEEQGIQNVLVMGEEKWNYSMARMSQQKTEPTG